MNERNMNIERAKAVATGYMSDEELIWLAEKASKHSVIAEVGSWTGRSTLALVENSPGIVFAIDTWKGSGPDDLGDILLERGEDWAWKEFQRNTANTKNLICCHLESTKAARVLEIRHRFDMIFLDAAHDYDSVCADILAWFSLLLPGGLLCGHDYGQKDGVTRAVQELIPRFKTMQPLDHDHSIWYVE